MEENLPIDIHYNKLLDWLISRRHCQANWQESILKVRQLINVAIQDMPAVSSITELLQGTYINYFHCKEIVEILKKTEGSSKSLFGSYSSKRLQDWMNIIKCYEKDNVFLAEAAQLLTRCVNYDIPSLKKQINKSMQAQQEYLKKESDYHRNSIEMKDKFRNACKALGIEGKKLKKELLRRLNDLPRFYEEIVRDSRNLRNEVDFYLQFSTFLSSGDLKVEAHLPFLRHLMEKGNTTVYELEHGHAPDEVIKTNLDFGDDDEADEAINAENEIDWGNLDGDSNADENQVIEIDWSIEDAGVVEVSSEKVDLLPEAESGRVARGNEACSVLEFVETRNKFLNDLHELEAFFSHYSQEMKTQSSSNFLISFIFQSAPPSLQVDADKVDVMLGNVRNLINKFQQPNIKELFLICSFPSYVDRLVENLEKMSSTSEKMDAQSKIMVVRQKEVLEEQFSLEPKLEIMRTKTKILKKQVENEISLKYKNRKVNIMGEINTI